MLIVETDWKQEEVMANIAPKAKQPKGKGKEATAAAAAAAAAAARG